MLRRLGALCAIVAGLAAGPAVLPAAPDAAGAQTDDEPGLGIGDGGGDSAATAPFDADVTTELTVLPAGFSAEVTMSYSLTNAGDVERASFGERLPAGATGISAVMGGRDATVTAATGPSADGHLRLIVSFDRPLQPGATLEGRLSYTLRFAGDVAELRHVSPGLIAIAPHAAAHGNGTAALTVRIPESFAVVSAPGWEAAVDAVTETDAGLTVLRAVAPAPYEPVALVAEQPGALIRTEAAAEGLDITVATLLPDPAAVERAEQAAQAVVELTGLASARPIEIRHGWAGDAPIRVVEDPSRLVAVVEPSAGAEIYAEAVAGELLAGIDWAEGSLLEDTAWAVATAAAAASSAADDAVPHAAPPTAGRWAEPLSAALAAITPEHARVAFANLAGSEIAYPGSAPGERSGPVDWRTMLDAFENLGGVQADAAFAEAGGAGAAAVIQQRAAARFDYQRLEEHADGWSLPLYLRMPLAEWRFGDYQERRDSVADLLEARDELATVAGEAGLEAGPHLREAFEAADSGDAGMNEPLRVLTDQRHALDFVAEAQTLATTDRGLLAGIGLMDYDSQRSLDRILALWSAGEFGEAEHEAELLIETYEGAVGRGTLRLVVPLLALSALAVAAQRLWARSRRKAPAPSQPTQDNGDDAASGEANGAAAQSTQPSQKADCRTAQPAEGDADSEPL